MISFTLEQSIANIIHFIFCSNSKQNSKACIYDSTWENPSAENELVMRKIKAAAEKFGISICDYYTNLQDVNSELHKDLYAELEHSFRNF